MVRDLKLEEYVKFLGEIKHERMSQIYCKSDISIRPDIFPEPFGRSMQEAMACKIPLITSDFGTSPAIIEGCSLKFKGSDSSDLAKKVIKLLKDEELKDSLVKNAYKKVLTSYTPEKVVSRILAVYEDVL